MRQERHRESGRGSGQDGEERKAQGAAGRLRRDRVRGMTGWIALSDRDFGHQAEGPLPEGVLERGLFVAEIALPLEGPQVLLDYRRGENALSLLHDAGTGIGLMVRQGSELRRHMLPGPLPQPAGSGIAQLGFRWEPESWVLRYELDGAVRKARGRPAPPLRLDDLARICAQDGLTWRHPGALWFGITAGAEPPPALPWIGLRTLVPTPTGLRPAGSLCRGEMVLTHEGRVEVLRTVRHLDLPARGLHRPVLLRAPYFSPNRDLLVSANQQILLGGSNVEYLFDVEEVLVEARYLTDGTSALFDRRRAVVAGVALELDQPALVAGEGVAFLSAGPASMAPSPLRRLHGYEVRPLLALLGRGDCVA
ncbi:MAG: Hint domain-containing protein [Gemmobacter sp.]|jgi:hypothetical protein|nr:Hint domain-containing protein [Gemmobacter sp.]